VEVKVKFKSADWKTTHIRPIVKDEKVFKECISKRRNTMQQKIRTTLILMPFGFF